MTAISSIGSFQILGTLGAGAHSSILHIRRNADKKHYALKVVPIESPASQKYLVQAEHELRVGRMLQHPNLVQVHALQKKRDWLFRVRKVHLLIEYVNGKTLDAIPKLTIPRLVQVFERIAQGLTHMHRRGVYHADLKPNNVMLSRQGEVKIIDYGLSWIKGEPKDRVQGTPEYMAPEQARKSIVNEQTDIYNLGATMYRLTTWRHPPNPIPAGGGLALDARTFAQMLKPVREYQPKAPAGLCDIIHQCLSYHANLRPRRVSEVYEALRDLAASLVRSPEDGLDGIEWDKT
jgi:serine/threonine protein kinase